MLVTFLTKFGPAETTVKLLKQCIKGGRMNCWEYKYIQEFQRAGKLITEQQTYDFNPLLVITPKRKEATEGTSQTSTVQQQPG
jgi:hypothetical protein